MRRLRGAFFVALLVATPCVAYGEIAQQEPDYSEIMIKNMLLPGLGFKLLGNDAEAKLYYAALPISLSGAGLAIAAIMLSTEGILPDIQYRDGETYLLRYGDDLSVLSQVMLYGGMALGLYGNLMTAYSSYGVHRDYVDRFGDPFHAEPVTAGRITLSEIIAAPFIPANVLSLDVLPILGLSTGMSFSLADYRMMGDFFKRDSVPFMGFTVPPAAGLGLQILSTVVLVAANAAWEEIAYRGLSLEINGFVYSSLSFGFAHLSNMLVPGASVEGTLLQTLFATAFGFYAAERAQEQGYDFRRMVALHFWHNTLSLILGYLVDPEAVFGFSIYL